MYYKGRDHPQELSSAEIEAIRKGFTGILHKLRYSPQFIANNADELISVAQSEYARATDKGAEIEDPVAWTIHCAWRRTQNFLRDENRKPATVSAEKLELVDEREPTPAEVVEQEDRIRKVRGAVSKLSHRERQFVALVYLEGMSEREAARQLEWSRGKARRCHERAMEKLYATLGVKSSDELEIEVGIMAWLSLAGFGGASGHLPAGLEAVADRVSDGAAAAWARAHELARRATGGGGGGSEAAGAIVSSGAGRAVGVCATGLVAVCLAGTTGLVPGVGGGVGIFAQSDAPAKKGVADWTPRPSEREAVSISSTPPLSQPEPQPTRSRAGGDRQSQTQSAQGPQAQASRVKKEEAEAEADSQFGWTDPGEGSSSTGEAATSESSSETVVVTPSGGNGSPAQRAEAAEAKDQFGAFR